MPWVPELFSAPALQQVLDKRRREKLVAVPYFDGLEAGEPDALVESFAGEPELYDPVRGRIKGAQAFEGVRRRDAARGSRSATSSVEDVEHVILERARLRGGGPAPRRCDGPRRAAVRDRRRPRVRRTDRRAADLLQQLAADRPPREPPAPAAARPRPAPSRTSWPSTSARWRPATSTRSSRRSSRTATPASLRAAVRPQRPGRPARLLRAVVLQRRRHPAGALRAHRRRARVRAGVQRRAVGQDGAAAAGRGRRLRPGRRAAGSRAVRRLRRTDGRSSRSARLAGPSRGTSE